MLRFCYFALLGAGLSACGGGTSGQIDTSNSGSTGSINTSISVAENIFQAHSLALNTDQDANVIIYAVTGGADAMLLTAGGVNGSAISFVTAPDFENPSDTDKNNIYELEITGTLLGKSAAQLINITVTDVAVVTAEIKSVLNDTGITLCGDFAPAATHNNDVDCISGGASDADGDPVPVKQDAHVGRDNSSLVSPSSLNKVGAGSAGFDFTKLNSQGEPLSSGVSEWSCVKDNVTGLIWEAKQDAGLHKKENVYTWYSTDSVNDGGAPGSGNSDINCFSYNVADASSHCNAQAYVARVNAAVLCGSDKWRLPQQSELLGLVDYADATSPRISTDYFKNTQSALYWAASPISAADAWGVSFAAGTMASQAKTSASSIRLVRGE